MMSPSCIIVSLSLVTSVYVCLLLSVTLELYCYLAFASSFHFLSDCPGILLRLGVCIMAYTTGFFVMLFSMSASGSALVFCCFVEWYCMYVSAITVVGIMWHLLHVMHLLLVVSCIMYDIVVVMVTPANYSPMSLWSTIFSLDHYCWPYGNTRKYCWGIIFTFCCLSMSLLWWSSSQSLMRGLQSSTGMMLQTCLLNINVARFSNPWPNGMVWIWRRAIFMSLPESAHFLNVHFMDFIQASTCPLLWWWYADDIACSTLIALQNWWNLSAVMLVPTSDIILQGILFLLCWLGFLLTCPLIIWQLEICCCNLQYTSRVYFWNERCLHWQLSMVWVVFCDGWSFLLAAFAESRDM